MPAEPILDHFLGQNLRGFHRVAYAAWGSDTSAPPVICVHGLTRNGRDFDWLATAMQDTRRLLCPDIAGRGHSDDLPDPTFYNYTQYVADMVNMIARCGASTVDWVGTSMGGIIGMIIAAQPNSPIRRLILNDIGAVLPLGALQRIAAALAMKAVFATKDELIEHMKHRYASFGVRRDTDWFHLAEHSYRQNAEGLYMLAYDPGIGEIFRAVDKDVDLWPVYDAVRCPTLILRGSQSDILSEELSLEMAVRGPKAKTVTFANVGHAPALIDPLQINTIRAFLSA